ncbi:hypothetical protein GALL_378540 [mine drainage metagenome]|uniref:Uncharacterized protein n=1 Tax=mine drainage metagenome TaxID=410659 RepID=A0A1J5QK92_9ZZZZ
MTTGTNVITREEFYELVWSTPMIKVAEKFDVSGSYLARVSIGNAHLPRFQWLAGHGSYAPGSRHGSSLAGFLYGGRERGASLP